MNDIHYFSLSLSLSRTEGEGYGPMLSSVSNVHNWPQQSDLPTAPYASCLSHVCISSSRVNGHHPSSPSVSSRPSLPVSYSSISSFSEISLSKSQTGQPATPLPDMRLTASKQAFPNKGFTQQQLNVLFCPIFGRQRLQKHHDALEIHSDEFV